MREDIRKKLIKVAEDKKLISYGELGSEFGIHAINVGKLVGEISLFESHHCRPLLSAVVINATTRVPSPGFWKGPTYLEAHRKGIGKLDFWEYELNRVYDYWQRHDP